MDLLYGSDQKFGGMDEDMSDFLDNDVFPSPTADTSNYNMDDEWFNSFFVDPVLNDKMITDAAQPPHIKSEHSYSTMNENSLSGSEDLGDMSRLEDLDSDFLIKNAALDLTTKTTPNTAKSDQLDCDPIKMTSTASTTVMTRTFTVTKQQPTIILASSAQGQSALTERSVLPKITVKTEPIDAYDSSDQTVNIDSLVLPPTPPSSSNSDSDSCPSPQRSAPSSPVRHLPYSRQLDRHSSYSSSLSPTGSSRHYSSSLYSSSSQSDSGVDIVFQQIPTSGVLMLTEEEKRTLISEGYPIPSKLPLTKQEEKNLKKIRRKIKNKISAQESRRKKKEYLEALEKRVESFSQENSELKKKVDSLENNNRSLLSQLQKLQSLVGKIPRPSGTVPQTGLMVLVLCFAVFLGSWTPTSLNIGYSTSKPGLPNHLPFASPQLVKPSPMMGPQIEGAKVDAYCTPPMKSRVLMSLRGEQDDLDWYDIYGPNIPNAELEKEDQESVKPEVIWYQPKVSSVEPEIDDNKNITDDNTINTEVTEESLPVEKNEVVEVTVDGRFGHANHSRDEPAKSVVGKDISRSDIAVEGLVESADNI